MSIWWAIVFVGYLGCMILLDFIWFIFPEWLGNIIKNVSGGWILAKSYNPETDEVIAYRLVCYSDRAESITLWEGV